mgnify:CR=1 FL=1
MHQLAPYSLVQLQSHIYNWFGSSLPYYGFVH